MKKKEVTRFQKLLVEIRACEEARDWVGERSLVESWRTCERPDWLLFFADKSETVTPVMWRLLACAFARSSLQYTTDPQPLRTIEVAERFARGEATQEELSAASSAAESAASSAAWRAAESAASSAAWRAAESAAWSAAESAAWSAAWSAAESAAYAASSAARSAAWSQQCRIVREHLDLQVIYDGFKVLYPGFFPVQK